LNFFWPVWAVGTPSCGGEWMTVTQSWIDGYERKIFDDPDVLLAL
jgi:hypothetical protein